MDLFITTGEKYYLFSTGTTFKAETFASYSKAEQAMYKFCNPRGIKLACTERDDFGSKFTNHNGVRFYLNRV